MAKSAKEAEGEQMISKTGYVIFPTGRVATAPSLLFWRIKVAVQTVSGAKLIRVVPAYRSVRNSLKYIWLLGGLGFIFFLLVLTGSCFMRYKQGLPQPLILILALRYTCAVQAWIYMFMFQSSSGKCPRDSASSHMLSLAHH